MKKHHKILILLLIFYACGQKANEMQTPKNANSNFEKFITKEKFVEENLYPGIADEKMQPIFTKRINQIASDFMNVANSESPTDVKYQEKIKLGLQRFEDVYIQIDTEDRERICSYIEEIMDIVELQSSNGQLNNFMYGFEPTEIKREIKYVDSNGNTFIEKGNEVFIIPAKYEKTGKSYKVFLYNETNSDIGIIEELKIKPHEFKVFNLSDTDTLKLDNGVKFMFGETYGLEVEDKNSQVSGLGGEYLNDYGVSDEIDWAFVIVPSGNGDKK